jgi:hypothetical protein
MKIPQWGPLKVPKVTNWALLFLCSGHEPAAPGQSAVFVRENISSEVGLEIQALTVSCIYAKNAQATEAVIGA